MHERASLTHVHKFHIQHMFTLLKKIMINNVLVNRHVKPYIQSLITGVRPVRCFVLASGIARTFLLMLAKNCFVHFVSKIGVDTPVADMVKIAGGAKHSGLGLSFHAKHIQLGEVARTLRGC